MEIEKGIREKEEFVAFKEVASVARDWMVDFMFRSLCYYFTNDQYKDFAHTRDVLQAIGLESSLKSDQNKKFQACLFLSRIMEGKNLDCQFEEDDKITPLESALSLWSLMENKQEGRKEGLYEEIRMLMFVQAVAVSMEKGQYKKASQVLDRLSEKHAMQESLKMKLSLIVTKKDTYHQFLMAFSFDALLKKVKIFIDSFLKDHPSDFLLKAATKVVMVCNENGIETQQSKESEEYRIPPLESQKPESNGQAEVVMSPAASGKENQRQLRPKRKLFSMQEANPWKPGSTRKAVANISYQLKRKQSSLPVVSNDRESKICQREPRRKQPWLWEEDMELKVGVKQFGEGHWSKILQHYNFKGRTSVMLKDRWRTMKKLDLVIAESE
ncbi:telomeric repeat-binding factor 1 isoform X1 [Acipenser oxyrinchus oxyrinchus]|uniref:Telomeric repeat-binding factor n=1 Tax=Acipenser oxyrinchus oxyrinchus TaxID=40147 RepID=A0AAD8LRB3_ACIOX|nr:telomeric repeat-binding factor 1 isoform X1 [Acipenser oxyrinchus oxyrinchus]